MGRASLVGGLEPLEARRMFVIDTVDLFHPPAPTVTRTGTLVAGGTEFADVVAVFRAGPHIRVVQEDPGDPTIVMNFHATRVKRISIDVGEGGDRVSVAQNVDRRCTIFGGAGGDVIEGGPGDTIFGGGGNDKLFARGVDPTLDDEGNVVRHAAPEGPASVVGGAGNDTLIVGEDDYVAGGPGTHDRLWYQSFMPEGGNALQFQRTEFNRLIAFSPIPEGIEDQDVWLRVVTPTGVRELTLED